MRDLLAEPEKDTWQWPVHDRILRAKTFDEIVAALNAEVKHPLLHPDYRAGLHRALLVIEGLRMV